MQTKAILFLLTFSCCTSLVLAQSPLADSLHKVIAENKDEGEVARTRNEEVINYFY